MCPYMRYFEERYSRKDFLIFTYARGLKSTDGMRSIEVSFCSRPCRTHENGISQPGVETPGYFRTIPLGWTGDHDGQVPSGEGRDENR